MKKVIKILGFLALCFTLSFVVTSCGNDEPTDESHDPNLIGTWVYSNPDQGWEKLILRANGTGRIEFNAYDEEDSGWCEFKWSGADGYLVTEATSMSDEDFWQEIMIIKYKVKGNQLYLDDSDVPLIKQK